MSWIATHFNYVVVVILMMAGLFIVFSSGNLIKRMIGLALFQSSTALFYISLGKVSGGTAAITLDAQSAEGKALAVRPCELARADGNSALFLQSLQYLQ